MNELKAYKPSALAANLGATEFCEIARFGAGSFFVVPRGSWHRQTIFERTQERYLSSGASEHSAAAAVPRSDS